jgi:hypothetical protein
MVAGIGGDDMAFKAIRTGACVDSDAGYSGVDYEARSIDDS